MADHDLLQVLIGQRDLTDPGQGGHPFQGYVAAAHEALAGLWGCRRQVLRAVPFRAYRAEGGRRRLAAHRSLTEALPGILSDLAVDPPEDLLLICPGPVLLVDEGRPSVAHEITLIRIARTVLGAADLGCMVQKVVRTLLPDVPYRLLPEPRPYTREYMRAEVQPEAGWTRLGYCARMAPEVLVGTGLDPDRYGVLAAGLVLERVHAVHTAERHAMTAGQACCAAG